MIGAALVLLARTRTGRALRACSQNREAAALLGIPVSRMLLVSFALSAALGAVAGILVTPTQNRLQRRHAFGVNGFIAAIIGGFGRPPARSRAACCSACAGARHRAFGAGFKNVAALSILLLFLLLPAHRTAGH